MLIPAVIRDDVSCRSGLWYPGSIPKRSTEQEAVIENYEMMVATLEDPNFSSKYVNLALAPPSDIVCNFFCAALLLQWSAAATVSLHVNNATAWTGLVIVCRVNSLYTELAICNILVMMSHIYPLPC